MTQEALMSRPKHADARAEHGNLGEVALVIPCDESHAEAKGRNSASSSPTLSEVSSDYSCGETVGRKRKRARTAFSNEQIIKLEEKFNEQKYLAPAEREDFAEKVGLSEMQVKTWFQNRRMKWKRQPKAGADVPSGDVHFSGYCKSMIYPVSTYPSHHAMFPSSLAPPVIPEAQPQGPQPMTTVHIPPIPLPRREYYPSHYPMPTALPHYAPFTHLPRPCVPFPADSYFSSYRAVPTPFGPLRGHYTSLQY
ncbi:homeobox protein ceh-30-like [Ptychodera flava]|uniref:homeobox protein ceh-30-like n=1 Tax=Ptychodera flava TaxID=63121 RepID=UPI003969C401